MPPPQAELRRRARWLHHGLSLIAGCLGASALVSMVSDWTGRNNEVLRVLAAEAERHPAWELYAAYCRDRLRGLRKQALSRLDEFLQQAQNWPFPERREFVDWLCSKLEKHGPLLTAPLPRPLLHSLIRPTLSEWAEADPDDPRPHRWQGIFRVDDDAIGHLRHAIAVDPTEQLARIRLAQLLISRL